MPFFLIFVQTIKIAMKRLFLFSLVGIVGLLGAGKANAQLHNMGLQMSMVWPKGNDVAKSGFNSLYGGLFYEYRFTGVDIDKNELRDHFGLEFGLNYTEFIKKGNVDPSIVPAAFTLYATEQSPMPPYSAIGKSYRSGNKGVNFYTAPKFYVTVYPELVELYVMGKVGLQYLNGSNSVGDQLKKDVNATNLFVGAAVGFELKLGTVFVGANFGYDTNGAKKAMEKVSFSHPSATEYFNPQFKPFQNNNPWGNAVLEFKIKALLNSKD